MADVLARSVLELASDNTDLNKGLADAEARFKKLADKVKEGGKDTAGFGDGLTKGLRGAQGPLGQTEKGLTSIFSSLKSAAGLVGVAFSVGAVINFGKSVFDAAGAIKDQSTALGFGAEAFQRIKFAVEQGGGSMEGFTKAAAKLNDNLAEGSKSTVAALKAAGLSFDAIRSMKPEDAFLAVSDAVGQIPDPMERARVAQDLFGKGAIELLPGMIEGYRGVAASASVMSDETIKRLADAQDAWEKLGNIIVTVTGEIIGQAMKDLEEDMQFQKEFWSSIGAFLKGGTGGLMEYRAALVQSKQAADEQRQAEFWLNAEQEQRAEQTGKLTVRTQAQIEADKKGAAAAEAHEKQIQELVAAISGQGLTKQVNDLAAAYDRLTPKQKLNLETLLRLADKARGLRDAGADLTDELADLVEQSRQLDEQLRREQETVFGLYQREIAREFMLSKMTVTVGQLTEKEQAAFRHNALALAQRGDQILANQDYALSVAAMPGALLPFTAATEESTGATDTFAQSIGTLASAFGTLGQISGGGVGDTLGNIGEMIGTVGVLQTAVSELNKTFTEGRGGIQEWTQAIASGATVLGTYYNVMQKVVAIQDEAWDLKVLRNDFIRAAGGADELARKADKAGVSLMGLYSEHATDVEYAMKKITEAFEAEELREAFVTAAGGIEALTRAARIAGIEVDDLFAARDPDAATQAIREIEDALAFQAEAMELLTETAKRYGFTLEELGPAMQRQELDKQAQQLYKDWEVLNAAGIDTVAITERMGESVSEYVQDAKAMGTEIPAAMRPMLEAMVANGTLLDENGEKITDLEADGVTFSMTMSEGFQALIDKVGELTEAISRGLGLAIENVPDIDVKGKVTYEVEPFDWNQQPDRPGYKNLGPGMGYVKLQHGTHGFRDFGTGTPAILHGWEAVVPRDEASGLDVRAFQQSGQRALLHDEAVVPRGGGHQLAAEIAAALGPLRAGGGVTQYHFHSMITDVESIRRFMRHPEVMNEEIERLRSNTEDFRGRYRTALEVAP